MIIDAHQHLWQLDRNDHGWLDDPAFSAIRRDFTPDDLAEAAPSVRATVAVQALANTADTVDLLAAALAPGPVTAVVGWADLTAPNLSESLDMLVDSPGGGALRGLRHLAQDEPDPDWLLRKDVGQGIALATAWGLSHDLLVRRPQRAAALGLVRKAPDTRFILDHAGKPDIGAREWDDWASWITALAALPNVTCKLSGLVTECPPGTWTQELLAPYAAHVLDSFGADRVMFGSDWPVCLLTATYAEVLDLASTFLAGASATESAAVLGDTAAQIYRLPST